MDIFQWLGLIMIGLGPLLLLSFAALPRDWANRRVKLVAKLATSATWLAFGAAIFGALSVALVGRSEFSLRIWRALEIGIYFDVLSAIMLLMVSFLGVIVVRYARGYLRGDANQGQFLKWLCATIGAVLCLAIAGNLVMFTLAWMAMSLSLNKLLTFYSDRPGALIAARKKFVISRLGDACLLGAIALVYQAFGTWNFGELFARAEVMRTGGAALPPQFTAICLLLVSGAMLKSAQFPFHSWLPDTMETPTPVSALMHAGIINGGGFLVVRLSPLIALSPISLELLTVVGAFTAIFASLIMMTQASIKRMLAFSTIAQMGFMMLQCGLGAFSIAVLHIVAHSLYKAHAFLSSGSVISLSKSSWVPDTRPNAHPLTLIASLLVAVGLTFGSAFVFGVSPLSEPGALILGAVFAMALTHLMWSLWGQSLSPRLALLGLMLGIAVSAGYFALHKGFKLLLAPAVPHAFSTNPTGSSVLIFAVIGLFGAVLVLQEQLPQWSARPWCRALYVHARNGFYFNTLANRAIQKVWPAR